MHPAVHPITVTPQAVDYRGYIIDNWSTWPKQINRIHCCKCDCCCCLWVDKDVFQWCTLVTQKILSRNVRVKCILLADVELSCSCVTSCVTSLTRQFCARQSAELSTSWLICQCSKNEIKLRTSLIKFVPNTYRLQSRYDQLFANWHVQKNSRVTSLTTTAWIIDQKYIYLAPWKREATEALILDRNETVLANHFIDGVRQPVPDTST